MLENLRKYWRRSLTPRAWCNAEREREQQQHKRVTEKLALALALAGSGRRRQGSKAKAGARPLVQIDPTRPFRPRGRSHPVQARPRTSQLGCMRARPRASSVGYNTSPLSRVRAQPHQSSATHETGSVRVWLRTSSATYQLGRLQS